MVNKIVSYFEKLKYLNDLNLVAIEMRNLLVTDMDSLKPDSVCENKDNNLDIALIRFFCRREHRFTVRLLDHFIVTGNTDMPDFCEVSNHKQERFKKIHAVVSELFSGTMLKDSEVIKDEKLQNA